MSYTQSLENPPPSMDKASMLYWSNMLDTNVRAGTLACLWCIKTHAAKKLALAFNRWKFNVEDRSGRSRSDSALDEAKELIHKFQGLKPKVKPYIGGINKSQLPMVPSRSPSPFHPPFSGQQQIPANQQQAQSHQPQSLLLNDSAPAATPYTDRAATVDPRVQTPLVKHHEPIVPPPNRFHDDVSTYTGTRRKVAMSQQQQYQRQISSSTKTSTDTRESNPLADCVPPLTAAAAATTTSTMPAGQNGSVRDQRNRNTSSSHSEGDNRRAATVAPASLPFSNKAKAPSSQQHRPLSASVPLHERQERFQPVTRKSDAQYFQKLLTPHRQRQNQQQQQQQRQQSGSKTKVIGEYYNDDEDFAYDDYDDNSAETEQKMGDSERDKAKGDRDMSQSGKWDKYKSSSYSGADRGRSHRNSTNQKSSSSSHSSSSSNNNNRYSNNEARTHSNESNSDYSEYIRSHRPAWSPPGRASRASPSPSPESRVTRARSQSQSGSRSRSRSRSPSPSLSKEGRVDSSSSSSSNSSSNKEGRGGRPSRSRSPQVRFEDINNKYDEYDDNDANVGGSDDSSRRNGRERGRGRGREDNNNNNNSHNNYDDYHDNDESSDKFDVSELGLSGGEGRAGGLEEGSEGGTDKHALVLVPATQTAVDVSLDPYAAAVSADLNPGGDVVASIIPPPPQRKPVPANATITDPKMLLSGITNSEELEKHVWSSGSDDLQSILQYLDGNPTHDSEWYRAIILSTGFGQKRLTRPLSPDEKRTQKESKAFVPATAAPTVSISNDATRATDNVKGTAVPNGCRPATDTDTDKTAVAAAAHNEYEKRLAAIEDSLLINKSNNAADDVPVPAVDTSREMVSTGTSTDDLPYFSPAGNDEDNNGKEPAVHDSRRIRSPLSSSASSSTPPSPFLDNNRTKDEHLSSESKAGLDRDVPHHSDQYYSPPAPPHASPSRHDDDFHKYPVSEEYDARKHHSSSSSWGPTVGGESLPTNNSRSRAFNDKNNIISNINNSNGDGGGVNSSSITPGAVQIRDNIFGFSQDDAYSLNPKFMPSTSIPSLYDRRHRNPHTQPPPPQHPQGSCHTQSRRNLDPNYYYYNTGNENSSNSGFASAATLYAPYDDSTSKDARNNASSKQKQQQPAAAHHSSVEESGSIGHHSQECIKSDTSIERSSKNGNTKKSGSGKRGLERMDKAQMKLMYGDLSDVDEYKRAWKNNLRKSKGGDRNNNNNNSSTAFSAGATGSSSLSGSATWKVKK